MAHGYDRASVEYEYLGSAVHDAAGAYTMSCFFNLADATTNQVLMSIANSGSDINYHFIMASSDGFCYIVARDNAGWTFTPTGNTWSANTWHHLCGIFASVVSRIIVLDGDWANRGTSGVFRFPTGMNKTAVGVNCRSTLQWPANGKIGEAAIFDEALSEGNVKSLADSFSPLFNRTSKILEYWQLINLPPVSRFTGNALTAVGSVSQESHCRIFQPTSPIISWPVFIGQLFCETEQNSLMVFSDLQAIPQLSCTPQGSSYTFEDLLAIPQMNCSVQNAGLRFSDLLIEG